MTGTWILGRCLRGARATVSGRGLKNTQPEECPAFDEALTEAALEAVKHGEPYMYEAKIANCDRAVGARSVGRDCADSRAAGAAGRCHLEPAWDCGGSRLGRLSVEGVKLVLTGQANDLRRQGAFGRRACCPCAVGRAALDSGQHVILGNVALYGGTAGPALRGGPGGRAVCGAELGRDGGGRGRRGPWLPST